MKHGLTAITLLMLAAVLGGCAKQTAHDQGHSSREPSAEGRKYLLTSEPDHASDIIAARGEVENNEEVTIVGRIGGRVDPWIDGRAAFSIVDRSLAACTDIPGDQCPTPWDYCCVTDKLPGATALVKIVDDQGQLIGTDAREFLGLHELQTVVVTGIAQRDESGNMTILANAIFAHPGDMGQYPPGGGTASAHDHVPDHEQADDREPSKVSESGN